MINIVQLICCVLAMSAGQIFFKLAALRVSGGAGIWQFFTEILLNRHLIFALAFYAGATLLWTSVLRTVPLKLAYPVVALSFVLVPLLGSFFVGENFSARNLVGGVVIVAGVLISVM